MGRVFVIDEDNTYSDILQKRGFDVFATANAYKLIKYAREIPPSLYVINADLKDTDYCGLVKHLVDNHYTDNAPLAVLHSGKKKLWRQGVSHYINKKDVEKKLPEIAEAYCSGGCKYDLLMVDNTPERLKTPCDLSAFEVYDAHAAKIFMNKNNVKAVAVHCRSELYDELCSQLGFEKTFYVDNTENIKDLVSFIK